MLTLVPSEARRSAKAACSRWAISRSQACRKPWAGSSNACPKAGPGALSNASRNGAVIDWPPNVRVTGSTVTASDSGGDLPRRDDPRQLVDEPVHLGAGVVVGQADAQDPCRLEAEPLDEPGRVEVAVPDGDPLLAQRHRGVMRRHAIDGDRR